MNSQNIQVIGRGIQEISVSKGIVFYGKMDYQPFRDPFCTSHS